MQNRIKNSSSTEQIVEQEKMKEQLKKQTKELDECKIRLEDEKASSINLFKSVQNSAQEAKKLKTELDSAVKQNHNLKIELENFRKTLDNEMKN